MWPASLRKLKNQRGGNVGYLKQIINDSATLILNENGQAEVDIGLASNKDIVENESLLKHYHDQILQFLEEEGDTTKEIEDHNNFMREIRKSLHAINKWYRERNKRESAECSGNTHRFAEYLIQNIRPATENFI